MKYVTLFVGDYTAYSKSFILLYSPCITSHPYDNGIGQDTGFFVDNSVKIQPCSSEKKLKRIPCGKHLYTYFAQSYVFNHQSLSISRSGKKVFKRPSS